MLYFNEYQITNYFSAIFCQNIVPQNNSKFIFMSSSLWLILLCKIPQFWAKATTSESSSSFSGKKTHRGYWKSILSFVPQGEPKKKVSAHGLSYKYTLIWHKFRETWWSAQRGLKWQDSNSYIIPHYTNLFSLNRHFCQLQYVDNF